MPLEQAMSRAIPAADSEWTDPIPLTQVPTSFGIFKPVGWVFMGLPTQAQADTLVTALHAQGWPADEVLHFTASETAEELDEMAGRAGLLSGFGYEITLLRRYAALAHQGSKWLLVKAADTEQAASAAEAARSCGATLAVHYRTLIVEELI